MFFSAVITVCLAAVPAQCEEHTLPVKVEARACRLPAIRGTIEDKGATVPVTVRVACHG